MPNRGKNGKVHNGETQSKGMTNIPWTESVSYNKAPSVSFSQGKLAGKGNTTGNVNKNIQGISSGIPQDAESAVTRDINSRQGKLTDTFKEVISETEVARDGWTIVDYRGRLDGLKSILKDRAGSLLSVVKGYKEATNSLETLNLGQINISETQHMINDLNAIVSGKLTARSISALARNMMPMERLAVQLSRYMTHEANTLHKADIGDQFKTVTVNDSVHLRDRELDPWATAAVMDGYHGEAQASYIIPTPVTTDVILKLREKGVSDRFIFDLGNYTNSESRTPYEVTWTGTTRTGLKYEDMHREKSYSSIFNTKITINDLTFDQFSDDQKAVWNTLFETIDAVNHYAYGMGDNLTGVDASVYNTLTPNSWLAPNDVVLETQSKGISAEFFSNLVNNNYAYINPTLIPDKGNIELDLNTENSATSPVFAQLGAVKSGTSLFNADFAIKLWMQAYMNTIFVYYATADIWRDALKINKVADMFKSNKPFTTLDDVYSVLASTDYASKVDKLISQNADITSSEMKIVINKELLNVLISNVPQEITYAKNGNYYEYITNLVLPLCPSMMTVPFLATKLANGKFEFPYMTATMLSKYEDFKDKESKTAYIVPSTKLVQSGFNAVNHGKLTNLDVMARYSEKSYVGIVQREDWLYDIACGDAYSKNENPAPLPEVTVKKPSAKDRDMKNPQEISGNSNINAAFKKDGHGGGVYGSFSNSGTNRPHWSFSFEYTNSVSRFNENKGEFDGIYIPEGLARSVMTNHWTDGLVLNGMIIDPKLMQQKAIEINFNNLMNLYDDVLTLSQMATYLVDTGNRAHMAACLAREISFVPDIAGPADLDVMSHIKIAGRDVPVIASSPIFPFVYNGTMRAPAIKGDMHTNRVFTMVGFSRGDIDPRIMNSAASSLPEAGANRDIIRIKQDTGNIEYTSKPLVLQHHEPSNLGVHNLLSRYQSAARGEENVATSVKVIYSSRPDDKQLADNLVPINNSPLYNYLCGDIGPNDPRSTFFLFVPAMGIDLAAEITRAVPRHYIIAKAFMLSILRRRWSGLIRMFTTSTARTMAVTEKLTRGVNWLIDTTINVNNLDEISHVKFNALDRDYLTPTVEVKTTHDLTATRMTEAAPTKFASSIDAIASAFTVENPIHTTAINQVANDYLAYGLFNQVAGQKLGNIHVLASQPERIMNSEVIRKNNDFFRRSNKLMLVSTPMSNYKGLDRTNRTQTYLSPISMFASCDLDKCDSINQPDYIHRLSAIVSNRVNAEMEDIKYTNDLIENVLTHSIEFDDYTGEQYTNDVVLPSIYDKPFAYVANDPILVQVGYNDVATDGRTLADISWMKYVNGPDMSRRGYSLFNMATIPAFSHHGSFADLDNKEFNPMVLLSDKGIRNSSIRQRQLTCPEKYNMFGNPAGTGNSSKKYQYGEFAYITESPLSLISRYSGVVTTGTEYWPTTIAKGCYAKSMTDRFANYEMPDNVSFDDATALQRVLIPTQNIMNREQYHSYINRIIWNLVDAYSIDKGYPEFMRALDNAITAIKLPFGEGTEFDTSGLKAIYAGRKGYDPKVHMDVMLYGFKSPVHDYVDTNTYTDIGIVGIYNMDGFVDAATLRNSYSINPALATLRREFVSILGCSSVSAYYKPYKFNTYEALGYDIAPVKAEHNRANGKTVFTRAHGRNANAIVMPFQKVRGNNDKQYVQDVVGIPGIIDYCYAHGNDPLLFYFNTFEPGYFSILTDNGMLQSNINFLNKYIEKYKINWDVKVNDVDYTTQLQTIRNWSR